MFDPATSPAIQAIREATACLGLDPTKAAASPITPATKLVLAAAIGTARARLNEVDGSLAVSGQHTSDRLADLRTERDQLASAIASAELVRMILV